MKWCIFHLGELIHLLLIFINIIHIQWDERKHPSFARLEELGHLCHCFICTVSLSPAFFPPSSKSQWVTSLPSINIKFDIRTFDYTTCIVYVIIFQSSVLGEDFIPEVYIRSSIWTIHVDVMQRRNLVVKDQKPCWDTVQTNHSGTGHELDEGHKKERLSPSLWAASKHQFSSWMNPNFP